MLREISITEIESIKIGHAQNMEQATGCTVILCEKGAPTGVDVRGGGPDSRESALLSPLAANDGIHGILLSGGSAFGLDAAGGVMRYLAERRIGFPVGDLVVPIVCEA
ncbi:P1 family peptidase, partial [Romboutsia ilealis]|uniref:P1 family peptidase n=1 Tax=Romboutsia ilealis TaxID=1115758 RepID=UPI00272D4F14